MGCNAICRKQLALHAEISEIYDWVEVEKHGAKGEFLSIEETKMLRPEPEPKISAGISKTLSP